jgi:Jacalin-like lectin domain
VSCCCLQATFIGGTTAQFGGITPSFKTASFAANEQITSVSGKASKWVNSISFSTNLRKSYGPFGGTAGTAFTFNGPVFSFYGTLADGCVEGIGFWTLAASIPPPPPPLVLGANPSPALGGTADTQIVGTEIPSDSAYDGGN